MAGKKRMAKWVGGRVGPTGYKLILIGTQASLTAAGLCISFSFFFFFGSLCLTWRHYRTVLILYPGSFPFQRFGEIQVAQLISGNIGGTS